MAPKINKIYWALLAFSTLLFGTSAKSQFPTAFNMYRTSPYYDYDFTNLSTLPAGMSSVRGTVASYYDSAGILQSAGINVARFDYDPATLKKAGLLVEPYGSNYLTDSNMVTSGDCFLPGSVSGGTANFAVAPDGTTTAMKIFEKSSAGTVDQHAYGCNSWSLPTGVDVTASIFVKPVSYTKINMVFNNWSGTYGDCMFTLVGAGSWRQGDGGISLSRYWCGVQKLPNSWYRIWATWSAGSGSSTAPGFSARLVDAAADASYYNAGTGGNYFLAWGPQIEIQKGPPTSFIRSNGSAGIRYGDWISFNSVAGFNATAGTLFAEYVNNDDLAVIDYNVFGLFGTNAQGTYKNNHIALLDSTINGSASVNSGGANQFDSNGFVNMFGRINRTAISYKASAYASANNGTPVSQSSGALPAFSFAYIGTAPGGENRSRWIRKIKSWKTNLPVTSLQAMTSAPTSSNLDYINGFETGSGLELKSVAAGAAYVTTPVRSGTYAMSLPAPGTTTNSFSTTLNAATTGYARAAFRVAVGSNPSAAGWVGVLSLANNGGTATAGGSIVLNVDTAGNLNLQLRKLGTTPALIGPTYPINPNQWYVLELKGFLNASTGSLEMKIDGISQSTQTGIDTGTGQIGSLSLNTGDKTLSTGSLTFYFDDLAFGIQDWARTGRVIARKGAPNGWGPRYNAFTKSSGTIDTVWSDIPYNATSNAISIGANPLQTMLVAPFDVTQSGQGTEFVDSLDSVNACYTKIVAKLNAAPAGKTYQIVTRIGVNDTLDTITPTVSDALYVSRFFQPDNSELGALEIGGKKTGTSGNPELVIEDAWFMCDFVAAY